jgi:hypothetical protein
MQEEWDMYIEKQMKWRTVTAFEYKRKKDSEQEGELITRAWLADSFDICVNRHPVTVEVSLTERTA